MADVGGISDYAILNQTRREDQPQESGWASLGAALGGGLGGPNSMAGQMAYARGAQMGATTVDALAQAKQRIQENNARETAASAVETDGAGGVVDPELRPYIGASIRAGMVKPEELMKALNEHQTNKLRATVASNPALSSAQAAAQALSPANAVQKAEGTNGSSFNPTQGEVGATGAPVPGQGGVTGVVPAHVGAEQERLNTGLIDLRSAQADAAAARAANPPGSKPPTGYQWALNPDGSQKLDENGTPSLTPITGGPKDPNTPPAAGSRERMMLSRVITGAKQVSTELSNMALLPRSATTGILGVGSTPGHSALQATTDYLRNKLSDESTQQLQTSALGLGRGLGSIEASGLVPPGTFTAQLENYVPRAGDTERTILWKQAQVRQIVENGRDVLASNPATPKSMVQAMDEAVARVQKSVPYQPMDVLQFEHEGKKGETFEAYLQRKHVGATPIDQGQPGPNGELSPADQAIVDKFAPKGQPSGGPAASAKPANY